MGLIDILSDGSDMQPKNTWEELAFYLQQVMDKNFKEQLNTILKVKESSSFEEFFESLGSATEKDIALVLIHQGTVVSPIFQIWKCKFHKLFLDEWHYTGWIFLLFRPLKKISELFLPKKDKERKKGY